MFLTKEQERMLRGERGEAVQKAMEILVALGDIYEADRLIPIKSSHISGISPRTSGEAGLEFVEGIAGLGAKVRVPTTINPCGVDLERWRELGAPEGFVSKQVRMVRAYERMGAEAACTCTPYLAGNRPSFGDHVAWSESSAVSFANSVLGARTNMHGPPAALAAALCGLVPRHGYHLDEERGPTIRVRPDRELFQTDEAWNFGVLGYWIGLNFPSSVPVIEGLRPSAGQLKALGAAMATSGAIALYHIPSITADAKRGPRLRRPRERVGFGMEEFEEITSRLDQTEGADLICIGCPHCSLEELKQLKRLLRGRGGREIWACTSRRILSKAKRSGLAAELQRRGVRLVADTCMVAAPMRELGYSSVAVDSAKAAHYAPTLAGVKVHFAPLKELLAG